MEFYGLVFFINNYNLDEDQVYEFVMGAIENSNIENIKEKVLREV